MDNSRPTPPATERERLIRDPVFGGRYRRLEERHQRVTLVRELVTKGRDARCSTCSTTWPCEVGQALGIIDMLLRS
jgi:hypothetical protein